jgi:hypothetical protein
MIRPDLEQLTDDDLARAASMGLLQRAKKELGDSNLAARAEWDGPTLVLNWSDGISCRFPPGRSVRGDCSCPANDLCRHLIRSVLWFRSHGITSPNESAKVEVSSNRSRAKPIPTIDELLSMDRPSFEKGVGKSAWNRGMRLLRETEPPVVSADRRQVEFPGLGVTISFPLGSMPQGAVCSCQASMPCGHLAPALIAWRGEADLDPPKVVDSLSLEERAASWRRVRDMVEELMVCGLDGLSSAWGTAAQATALELEKKGLVGAARLLDRLGQQIESQRTGVRPFRTNLYRRDVAALWLAWEKGQQNDPSTLIPATASHRSRSARVKSYVGVGAQGWWTDEVSGLSIYLQDVETGDIVMTSTARPIEKSHSPSDLARASALGKTFSARDLLGRWVVCASSTIDEGRLRVAHENDVELRGIGVDWLELYRRTGVDRWDHLADRAKLAFPSLLTGWRPEIQWIIPFESRPSFFDTSDQRWVWPMLDRDGRVLTLQYDYRSERADIISQLERASSDQTPLAVLARYLTTESTGGAEPIAFLYAEQDGSIRHWVPDIDDWERKKHGSRKKS